MERILSTSSIDELGPREIGVIASTNQLARDGHILEPSGIDLRNYRANPVVLFSHDPESPVATCTGIGLENGKLAARIQFAPEGASEISDQICNLVKGGVLRGISIGFEPIDFEPLDSRRPRGGQHILTSELLEISIVSLPADTGAMVTARSVAVSPTMAAAFRALPAPTRSAMQRAADLVMGARGAPVLNRTMAVWAALNRSEREHEERYGLEARRREAERLKAAAADATAETRAWRPAPRLW